MKNPPSQPGRGGNWNHCVCGSASRLRERIEDVVDCTGELDRRFIFTGLDFASETVNKILPDVGFFAGESSGCGAGHVGDIDNVLSPFDASWRAFSALSVGLAGVSANGLSTKDFVSTRDASYLCHVNHSIFTQTRGRSAIFADCAIPTGPHPTNHFYEPGIPPPDLQSGTRKGQHLADG
jgi:hypothetical protein